MRIGLYVSVTGDLSVQEAVARFVRAEACGFHTGWLGQLNDHDALTILALAARQTRRIELGTWVIPVQPRHPAALAQQALTTQAASEGRLLLGIGVSHEAVIERRFGLSYARPLQHMRETLDALLPLLAGDAVSASGERVSARLRLNVAGAAAPTVLVAALGPRMLDLAGARADGAAIWLGGLRYLEDFALPRLRKAAERAGRGAPRVACGFPVAVTSDVERGRAAAQQFLAQSSRLPAYRRVLDREGAASPAELAIIGDEREVARQLRRIADLGVTDFHGVTFPDAADPEARERTRRLLPGLL